jgi:hypothetical protein
MATLVKTAASPQEIAVRDCDVIAKNIAVAAQGYVHFPPSFNVIEK